MSKQTSCNLLVAKVKKDEVQKEGNTIPTASKQSDGEVKIEWKMSKDIKTNFGGDRSRDKVKQTVKESLSFIFSNFQSK